MVKKKTTDSTEITLNNYQELLAEIKGHIIEAGQSEVRSRLVMAWKTGRSVDKNLKGDERAAYGKKLFKDLEKDLQIREKTLYKMHNFYQTYKELPKDDSKLNWSHYRSLVEIKGNEQRQYLENLAIENSWGSNRLAEEVKKSKDESKVSSTYKSKPKNSKLIKSLQALRGQLFSYHLVEEQGVVCLDLGFNIFREVETKLSAGQIVDSLKKDGQYSIKPNNTINPKKLHMYQAKLIRVVDGDTLRVSLDLGFNVWHHQILRLRAINAAEKKTVEGPKSTKILQEILEGVPFLVLRTTKVDQHGRYVCDVFFDEKKDAKADPQKVADEGVFLNQLLVDCGSVKIVG